MGFDLHSDLKNEKWNLTHHFLPVPVLHPVQLGIVQYKSIWFWLAHSPMFRGIADSTLEGSFKLSFFSLHPNVHIYRQHCSKSEKLEKWVCCRPLSVPFPIRTSGKSHNQAGSASLLELYWTRINTRAPVRINLIIKLEYHYLVSTMYSNNELFAQLRFGKLTFFFIITVSFIQKFVAHHVKMCKIIREVFEYFSPT